MTNQEVEQLFNLVVNTKMVDNNTPDNKDDTLQHIVSDNIPMFTQEELDRYIYGSSSNNSTKEDPVISLAKKTTPEAIQHTIDKERDPENNELYLNIMLAE